MDINTQICTIRQQAKRLLEFELIKLAADCCCAEDDLNDAAYMLESKVIQWNDYFLPAWSLHRLIALLLSVVVLFLSRKLKKEKEKARKTIDDLNREMLQKDNESRTKVASLLKELENKDKETSSAICQLRNELQNQEENHRQYMEETEQLLHDMQDRLQEKSLRATGMFRNTISTMGEILSDFDNVKLPNTRLESIVKHWKKDYFIGDKALDNLERLVNEFQDDAMYHFREEVHLSSKEDYQQACCLFAGISIRTVACLMGKNEKGLYQWRLRLREKIESSSVAHKEQFLGLLGK